jgi:hypothetical protein
MAWEVEYTDEFGAWWNDLDEGEQDSIDVVVDLLEAKGPGLRFPFSSGVNGSRHAHMRELRVQHKGEPYRILYAFDPRRTAILLLGGNKTGDDRWYERWVPRADQLYDEHLKEIEEEGRDNG